jgi:hypothetical protein
MTRLTVVVALVGLTAAAAAQGPAADEPRAAWRYRRDVAVPNAAAGAFVAVPLPPEVAVRSQRHLEDLRLVDGEGRETPYLMVDDQPRADVRRVAGALAESRQDGRFGATWTADFGAPMAFDRLELEIPARDFAARFVVEGSTDGTTWLAITDSFWAFDRLWQGRPVHDTALDVPVTTARFVRFTGADRRPPVRVTGAFALLRQRTSGSTWTRSAAVTPREAAPGRSRYTVEVPAGFPVRRLEIDADDPAFARPVEVLVHVDGGAQSLGQATVYRLRLPDAAGDVEARVIDVAPGPAGTLTVDVQNGDSPPLTNPRVILSGPQTLLLAAPISAPLTLYYGNAVTRRAVYDLERLRPQLTLVAGVPLATTGEEVENPRFRAPTPLGFLPARGAAVDSGAWQFVRRLHIQAGDDLYALTLDPGDAGRARADLADLRLVDAANRQVPYVLERDVATVSVPLEMAPAQPLQERGRRSAVRLRLPSAALPAEIALTAIEFRMAESYFRRAATVSVTAGDHPQGRRVVGTAMLVSTDRAGESGAIVRIPLGSVIAPELVLEIDDGDNAPLTVQSATALVPVPRLTFKATAGEYRLLFGNDEVEAPSYELDRLRREVLDYSAVPVPAEWLDATAATGGPRRLGQVLREPPATAVLWAALATAVVVLLVLTRRIVKAEAPERRP